MTHGKENTIQFKEELQKQANKKLNEEAEQYWARKNLDIQASIEAHKKNFVVKDEHGRDVTLSDKVKQYAADLSSQFNNTQTASYIYLKLWTLYMALGEQLNHQAIEIGMAISPDMEKFLLSGIYEKSWRKNGPSLESALAQASLDDNGKLTTKSFGFPRLGNVDIDDVYKKSIEEWLKTPNESFTYNATTGIVKGKDDKALDNTAFKNLLSSDYLKFVTSSNDAEPNNVLRP